MLEKLPESIGHALHEQRAGLDKTAFNQIDLRTGTAVLQLGSLAFNDHAPMPADCTADGPGLSPQLHWSGVPAHSKSLVLIVEDADAPTPQPLVHAIVVDLPPQDGALDAGALASPQHDGSDLHTGRNSYLQASWLPPDPPAGHGVHRYVFQLFALDVKPDFSAKPGRGEVLDALRDHAIASGCLIGTYQRPDGAVRIGDEAPVSSPITPA